MDPLLAVFGVGSAGLLVYAVLAKPPASARWFKLLLIVLALVSVGYAGYVVVTGDRPVALDFGGFLALAFWTVFGILAGWIYFRRPADREKAGEGT